MVAEAPSPQSAWAAAALSGTGFFGPRPHLQEYRPPLPGARVEPRSQPASPAPAQPTHSAASPRVGSAPLARCRHIVGFDERWGQQKVVTSSPQNFKLMQQQYRLCLQSLHQSPAACLWHLRRLELPLKRQGPQQPYPSLHVEGGLPTFSELLCVSCSMTRLGCILFNDPSPLQQHPMPY